MTADQCIHCKHYDQNPECCMLIENITSFYGECELDGSDTVEHLEKAWYEDEYCNHQKLLS